MEPLDSEEWPTSRLRKGIYVLPNLFTLAALFGGFYAIVMAMNNQFEAAVIGVFAAMVLDSLDGRVARMTNTQRDRKSTRLNSSHSQQSRMPSSA